MIQRLLVAAQFALIGLIAWPWWGSRANLAALLLIVPSGLIALWTLRHNRPGNFNIRPALKEGAELVTSGPYLWVRNPMYVSLLLLMLGVAVFHGQAKHLLPWFGLVIVLAMKVRLEEAFLLERFPDYAEYMARVKRFIPRIY